MNDTQQYQWHEHIQIVNAFDPDRTANLLLPVGVECPSPFTEADFAGLFPEGAHIYTVSFFGVACGWFARPLNVQPCSACCGGNSECAVCGGSGYVQLLKRQRADDAAREGE